MEDAVPFIVTAMFVAMLVIERIWPARRLPVQRWWLARGIASFVILMGLSAVVPLVVAPWIAPYAILDGERLGPLGGVLVTLTALEFASYYVHRTNHRVAWLWRWTHQMHHAAERVDVAGSVMFHPNDIVLNAVVSTAVLVLLGVSGEVAAVASLIEVFAGMFQHLNVKTPVWLGYIIQRPEGHSVHHQRGVHAYNYGNLTLFDWLFGTFRNPREFSATAGFWDGASSNVGAMLVGRDVSIRERRLRSSP